MQTQTSPTGIDPSCAASPPERIAALCAALVAYWTYLRTLAPTVAGEDTGELIAAAYTLGIPHPPGYPLWCLLAKGFIVVLPFGEVAWRVNLMSAVFAALTVWLVAHIVLLLTRNPVAAAAGALVFAFSREFWEQSVIAEVYTLNAFFTALCTYLLLRWGKSRDVRLLYGFSMAYGLSLCNHATMLLLAPGYVIFVLALDRRTAGHLKRYGSLTALTLLPLSLYLYLPLRSLANPAMDWGNPESWRGFWAVVSRRQYAHLITDAPRSLGRFAAQTWIFLKIFVWEFTPWVGWLAPAGLVLLWRRARAETALLASSFLVVAFGAILIPNFPLEHHWIWINTPYWIPAYLFAAVLIGIAIAALPKRGRYVRVAVPLVAVAIVLGPYLTHYRQNDMSGYSITRDYARNLLETMEPEAVYLGSGDHTVFPLLYLQIVEGQRPDVDVVNKYGYPEADLYASMPETERGSIGRIPSKEDTGRIFSWLLAHSDRPMYSTVKRAAAPREVRGEGLLYRYVREGENSAERDLWAEYRWDSVDDGRVPTDWSESLVRFEVDFARARDAFEAGNTAGALRSMERAADVIHEDKHALNNLGTLAAEYGEYEQAAAFFEAALAGDPGFFPARLNLARAYLKLQQPQAALAQADHALALDPDNTAAQRVQRTALRGLSTPQ